MKKYMEIEAALRSEFSSGKYAGGRFPSEHMLVKRFGVARGTVRQALSRLEADGLIVRHRGSGTHAESRTNPATGRLGLLIPDMADNLFFRLLTSELVRCGQSASYVMLLGECATTDSVATRRRNLRRFVSQFIEQRVEGVVFRPFLDERLAAANRAVATTFRKAGIPVVLIDADLVRSPARSDFDLVGINHVNAGRRAAELLISAGRKNLRYILPRICTVTRDRVFGAAGAALAAGCEWDDSHVLKFAPDDTKSLKREFASAKANRPDGVICGDDVDALTLIRSLAAIGISVPRDVSVVGCDNTPEAHAISPEITTLAQPIPLIAETAVKVLRKRIRNPSEPPVVILFDAPLVPGGTV